MKLLAELPACPVAIYTNTISIACERGDYPSFLLVTQQWYVLTGSVTALCSEGPMFRRSYVQKVLCSEGLLFKRFYVQKVLCSEGSIFRRFYVQKVLCSEIFVQKVLWLESTLLIKQYYLFNLSESVYIYNKKYVF